MAGLRSEDAFHFEEVGSPRNQVSAAAETEETSRTVVGLERVGRAKSQEVWYDAAHTHLVALIERRVTVSPRRSAIKDFDLPTDINNVVLIKYSLDGSMVAIQISKTVIEVLELSKKQRWKVELRGRESGLASWAAAAKGEGVFSLSGSATFNEPHLCLEEGIFWSDHGGNSQDLIVCGTRGIDLYKVSSARSQCKLVRSLLYPASNVWYEPKFRCLVLGSGPYGSELRPYFLKSRVSDLPKFELPPPEKVKKFQLYSYEWKQENVQQLRRDQLSLFSIYTSLCLAHTSADNAFLTLYWIDRSSLTVHDAILRLSLSSAPEPGLKIAVAVHDDILIAMRLRPNQTNDFFQIEHTLLFDVDGWGGDSEASTLVLAATGSLDDGLIPLSLTSAGIFRTSNQDIVQLTLNLEAIAHAKKNLGHRRELASFLLRRTHAVDLLADLLKELIVLHNEQHIDTLDDVLEVIADRERQLLTTARISQYHLDYDNATEISGTRPPQSPDALPSSTTPVQKNAKVDTFEFSQAVAISSVFNQLQQLSSRARADALLAYVWALHRRKVPVSEVLALETAAQLLEAHELRELAQLIHFKVLPDSRALAQQLLADPGAHSAGLDQLGLDMLHRLKSPVHLARELAKSGRLHDAIRLVSTTTKHQRDCTPLLLELVSLLLQETKLDHNDPSLETESRRLLLIALAGNKATANGVSGLLAQLPALFSSSLKTNADDNTSNPSYSALSEAKETRVREAPLLPPVAPDFPYQRTLSDASSSSSGGSNASLTIASSSPQEVLVTSSSVSGAGAS